MRRDDSDDVAQTQHGHDTYETGHRAAPLPPTGLPTDAQRMGLTTHTPGGAAIEAAGKFKPWPSKHAWLYYFVIAVIIGLSILLAVA